MTSSRRFDIIIGLLAGAIAVMGLAASLLTRNEDAGWFGRITRSDRAALLAIAIVVLGAAVAKAVCARRR